ncbi:MAG: O-antigen ligase family protein [Candidatus Sumerlaeota bacterium]
MFGNSSSGRRRRSKSSSRSSSSRSSVITPKPRKPIDWLTWTGISLFIIIFAGGLHPTAYIVDATVRSYAWGLCGLFAIWGMFLWLKGKWNLSESRPALWIIAFIAALAVIGGLQLIPVSSSFVTLISPIHREIQQSLTAVGFLVPERIPFATAPEKAAAGWDQLIAMGCFFIGVSALSTRRAGAIAMISSVILFSFLEGIIGVLRFTFTATGRSSGIVFNPNHHAAAVIMGLPLAIAAISHIRASNWGRMRTQVASRGDQMLMLTVIACIAGVGWLLSMSRGSLISGACVLTAWWVVEAIMNYREYSRKQSITFTAWFRGLPLLPILIPCICLVLLLFSAAYLPQIVTRFTNPDQHLFGRMELWLASLKGLAQTHFLGMGFGGTEYALNRYIRFNTTRYAPIQAHNDFVQIVAELGIIAGIIGCIAIGGCAKALYRQELEVAKKRNWTKRFARRAILVGVLITLIHSLFDFHLRVPVVCFEFLTLLALLLSNSGAEPLMDSARHKLRGQREDDKIPILPPAALPKGEHLANPAGFGLIESDGID